MQVPMPQMMNMGMVGGGIMGMGFNPATGTLQPQQQQQPGINANVNVSNSNSGIGAIPAHERVAYDALFHQTTTGKPLSGELARGLFSQSGLPVDVLAKIWDLSDIDKDGMLDREEFSIACYLTRLGVQSTFDYNLHLSSINIMLTHYPGIPMPVVV
ncbi:hypothetical protein Pelo_15853 [Pelomyxa schiedti]|nr:hypothetical protein Pelo_15853 [Pelomyxa schiedti]